MRRSSRSTSIRKSRKVPTKRDPSAADQRVSSEEAIKAGEQIAMAAFSSGLKLAAAFGTVAAKTAGLALASLASGADRFSELVKEEALRSYDGTIRVASSSRTRRSRKKSRSKRGSS